MKTFGNWFVKNLSNIFGLIGIILTLYFGVFYVPSWLREAQEEKSINAQRNLKQSVKELIYSDSISSYNEISTLIRAKELELNEPYPYTPEEFLTQVQESFMQDRYLPLEKRKSLISELEELKNDIPKLTDKDDEIRYSKARNTTWISELLSIIISILGVIAGIISFYYKFRTEKEKDEEIENQILENEYIKENIEYAYEFESKIISLITNYPGVQMTRRFSNRDFGFDLEFSYNNKNYFVEIKFLNRSKIGLKTFQRFLASQRGLEGNFWFIYNTDLTDMVKRKAAEFSQINDRRNLELIKVDSLSSFKEKLEKLLPTTPYKNNT